MKKLFVLSVGMVCGVLSIAQRGTISIQHTNRDFSCVVGAAFHPNRIGLNGFLAGKFRYKEHLGVFGGYEMGQYIGYDQQSTRYPYEYLHSSYAGFFAGPMLSFRNLQFGAGIDIQKINKKGDLEDRRSFSLGARGYVKTILPTLDLFASVSLGKGGCYYVGYGTVHCGTKIDCGLYANNAALGIGPMVRWGADVQKKNRIPGKRYFHPYVFSIGYHIPDKRVGCSIVLLR